MSRTFTKHPILANENKDTDNVVTYQNNRNPNKYVEVKKGDDGHSYVRQYMKIPNGKNYNGGATNRGRYHRATQQTINQILEDYNTVQASTTSSNLRATLSDYVRDVINERLDNIAIEIASKVPEYAANFCSDVPVSEADQEAALNSLVDCIVYNLTYNCPNREDIGY